MMATRMAAWQGSKVTCVMTITLVFFTGAIAGAVEVGTDVGAAVGCGRMTLTIARAAAKQMEYPYPDEHKARAEK